MLRMAIIVFLPVSLVRAQASDALKLEKTIELPEVQGRIVDMLGVRLGSDYPAFCPDRS
jgi:hypothetical protein